MFSDAAGFDELSCATGLRHQPLLSKTLRSAHFWELPAIRGKWFIFIFAAETKTFPAVLLEFLNGATLALDDPQNEISALQLCGSTAAYRLLLELPPEYISRPFRANFTRRALVADDLFGRLRTDPNNVDKSLTILRTFLKRFLTVGGSLEQPVGGPALGEITFNLSSFTRPRCSVDT